jgi:predicted N-acyltransferase
MFFDYLPEGNPFNWPPDFSLLTVEGPDTRLQIEWPDFESYLHSLSKSARKDYHRHTNRAADLGIEIHYHSSVTRLEEALPLIRAVDEYHHTPPNPHARHILENAHLADSTWITAEIEGRLAGCGLLIGDQGTQILTLLGLDYSVQFVYFQLVYGAIRRAIETGVQDLRGGAGAYDLKQRLGFQLDNNNTIAFTAHNRALRWLTQRFI